MRFVVFALFIALGLWGGEDPYAPIRTMRLANGMTVYLYPDDRAEKVQIDLEVGVGRRAEDRTTAGLSHLCEHLVFRDERVTYHDYVDLIKERGGEANGYTYDDGTLYTATVKAQDGDWLLENIYRMLFDKRWRRGDLEVERGALLAEIGEPRITGPLFWGIKRFFKAIMPPNRGFWYEAFSMSPAPDPVPLWIVRRNTVRFDLEDIKGWYRRWYYPANMTLMVTGGFDPDAMTARIRALFEQVPARSGPTVPKLPDDAALRGYPYIYNGINGTKNVAWIGGLYLFDDYADYLCVAAYTDHLATRLRRKLRNEQGRSYDVGVYRQEYRNAGVAAVTVDGTNAYFDINLNQALSMWRRDAIALDDATIDAALNAYRRDYFPTPGHDCEELMGLVQTYRYLKEHYDDNRTPYQVFNAIDRERFRQTVAPMLEESNAYRVVWRESLFFRFDFIAAIVTGYLLVVFAIRRFFKTTLRKKGWYYEKDDILHQGRIASRISGFGIFLLAVLIAIIAMEWIKYGLFSLLFFPGWDYTRLSHGGLFVALFLDIALFTVVYIVVLRVLFGRYRGRVDVTADALYLVGSKIERIGRDEIEAIFLAERAQAKEGQVRGFAWRRRRPVVAVRRRSAPTLYLLSARPQKMVSFLKNWLRQS